MEPFTSSDFEFTVFGVAILVAAVASTFLLSGCGGVSATRVNPGEPKSEGCQLEIFAAESEVEREFVTACLINSQTGTTAFADKSASAAIEKAKPEACECGADALLIESSGKEGPTQAAIYGQGQATIRAIRFEQSDQDETGQSQK